MCDRHRRMRDSHACRKPSTFLPPLEAAVRLRPDGELWETHINVVVGQYSIARVSNHPATIDVSLTASEPVQNSLCSDDPRELLSVANHIQGRPALGSPSALKRPL